MKNFIRELNKDGDVICYLKNAFPKLSDGKIEAGIFDGPLIRKLFADPHFTDVMVNKERRAWLSFRSVVTNFLGNRRSTDYEHVVDELLQNFQALGANMSIKMHFLSSHLDYFPDNCGDYSEEQGERFHQDIKVMEERYQGRWDVNMLADYCWCLKRDDHDHLPLRQHKRKAIRKSFTPQ